MKFAKFWEKKEVSVDKNFFGVTVLSVWGASNVSQEDASLKAESRAEHLKRWANSNPRNPQEYEYSNGFVREEVIEEISGTDGQIVAVITRNSYGALVINSESVFFADIDVKESGFLARILEKVGKQKKDKHYYLRKIEAFQHKNPEYTLRVYETCAGLRVTIINTLLNSQSSITHDIFAALDTDPLYVRLCKNQSCFRARLSPKPWRINIERPASRFPRNKESDQIQFARWLRNYQLVSKHFAVAKILETFGSAQPHEDIEQVLSIHDRYSCSTNAKLA